VQYAQLTAIISMLRQRYPALREAEIVGHSDIAPGRKTDPGPAFDWTRFDAELAAAGG
jgi:AmpD protein